MISRIYSIIRDYWQRMNATGDVISLDWPTVQDMLVSHGFKKNEIDLCIEHYDEAAVWVKAKNKLTFLLDD